MNFNEMDRALAIISLLVGILLTVITRNPAMFLGTLSFFSVVGIFIKIYGFVDNINRDSENKSSSNYTNFRRNTPSGGARGRSTSAQAQRRNPNVPKKNSNAPVITAENFSYAVALPEGVRLTPKEENIIKMILNNPMTPKEILSRVPRSVNIYEYKEALQHLEEIGVIKLGEDGRYALVLREDFLRQEAVEQKILQDIYAKERREKERIRLEKIQANAICFNEEDLTPQEKFIINIVQKRKMRAQDILKVIPREEDITPYKDAINHLKDIMAIEAKPDGTLEYNESFFVLSGQEGIEEFKEDINETLEEINKNEAATATIKTPAAEESVKALTTDGLIKSKDSEQTNINQATEEYTRLATLLGAIANNKAAEESSKAKAAETTAKAVATDESVKARAAEELAKVQLAETQIKTETIEKTTKNETAKTPVATEPKDDLCKTVTSKSVPDYTATLTEDDIKQIAGNAANIAEMFKARFSGPFGLDNKKVLMLSAGMAGYACHQAVMANKLPYNPVTEADGRKFYMGDSVNKYLLDGKYSVLSWCDGFFETAGKFFTKPDPTEVVKKEVNAVKNKEYRIWDSESPVVTYKEVQACWEGIYDNMTAKYCNKPNEWPVLYGIVLQNIMLEVSRIMTISDVYEKALECAIYISWMDEDSIR